VCLFWQKPLEQREISTNMLVGCRAPRYTLLHRKLFSVWCSSHTLTAVLHWTTQCSPEKESCHKRKKHRYPHSTILQYCSHDNLTSLLGDVPAHCNQHCARETLDCSAMLVSLCSDKARIKCTSIALSLCFIASRSMLRAYPLRDKQLVTKDSMCML